VILIRYMSNIPESPFLSPCLTSVFFSIVLLTLSSCATSPGPKEAQQAVSQHQGVGTVIAINPDRPSVEINHQEIEGFMPAMQMEFYVKDKSALDSIKPGDQINFTVEINSGIEVVSAIQKR
jgi:Cu(I)/Ag(I) efflux system periplasmic protein CusF